MSTYLYSSEGERFELSASLSRLILALVNPFEHEANHAFLRTAEAEQDAEIERLRTESATIGYGPHPLWDPLDGRTGVRGGAFALADAVLPREFDEAIFAMMAERRMDSSALKEEFPEARSFIAERAVDGEDVFIN